MRKAAGVLRGVALALRPCWLDLYFKDSRLGKLECQDSLAVKWFVWWRLAGLVWVGGLDNGRTAIWGYDLRSGDRCQGWKTWSRKPTARNNCLQGMEAAILSPELAENRPCSWV